MTSRERVVRALTFQDPDRAPRDLWTLPGVQLHRRSELATLRATYPSDFGSPPDPYGPSQRIAGDLGMEAGYTDEWGCVWSAAEDGVVGEVKEHPLADWSNLPRYAAPYELLDNACFKGVNAGCAQSDQFVRANTGVRPFERMQFLRGTENLFSDLAHIPTELYALRELVHDYFLVEVSLWAMTDVDGVSFMDDWGSQQGLLIDPELWRSFFKPMYRDYCRILKERGKFVFFHSDGNIEPILPDLIEIGVDAVNSQLFCMNMERIARRYKGHITFWGEICRQHVLPFGDTDDVRDAVRRVRRAFDDGTGGLIAQCEWGLHDPMDNIAAVFEAWCEPLVIARTEGAPSRQATQADEAVV
jgi:hypothetical protein